MTRQSAEARDYDQAARDAAARGRHNSAEMFRDMAAKAEVNTEREATGAKPRS